MTRCEIVRPDVHEPVRLKEKMIPFRDFDIATRSPELSEFRAALARSWSRDPACLCCDPGCDLLPKNFVHWGEIFTFPHILPRRAGAHLWAGSSLLVPPPGLLMSCQVAGSEEVPVKSGA